MDIKDVRIKKGMSREEVNELISEWIELEDEIYMGNAYKHNWVCKCGNVIEGRMWGNVRKRESCILCSKCRRNNIIQKHKDDVDVVEGYAHIESYLVGDITSDGVFINKRKKAYMKVRHEYCGSEYVVGVANFINDNQRCGKCCQTYENSFAHHIEVELGLNINDVWDFEKNTVNPYHISKGSHSKIWLKCLKDNSHPLYDTYSYNFIDGHRCSLCNNSSGENIIKNYLDNKNITFEYEYSYMNLTGVGGNPLSYDFYLPSHNILIEYQGRQHEMYIPALHKDYSNFERQLEHDRRKREYAKNNNIKLLEIWQYDFDNIEEILNKEIINSNKPI